MLASSGLFLLALGVRALPWTTVLAADRVYLAGADSYYHMRRILYSLHNFPAVLDFDPYINFPHGARAIWSSLYDFSAACVLRPFYSPGGEAAVERLAAWLPPFLGALTVVVLFFLVRRLFGTATALLSGLFLCFLSGHFWYSQIGFIDHHAAVALITTLLLASAMRLLGEPSKLAALWTGVLMAAAIMLWPGSLLHVGIIEIGLLAFLLVRADAGFALLFTLAHAVGFLLLVPYCAGNTWPQWGSWTPVVISNFQPWMFGVLAVFGAVTAVLWRRFKYRRISAVLLGIVLLGLSLAFIPGLRYGAVDAWEWFSKQESFQGKVSESQPLFGTGVNIAELRLSRFVYLLPFALLAMGLIARKPAVLLFILWGLFLGAATLIQKRFINTFSVAMAVAMGWSFVAAFKALPIRFRATQNARFGVTLVFVAIAVLLLFPVFTAYQLPLLNLMDVMDGDEPTNFTWPEMQIRMQIETARWLRENTPPTSGFLDCAVEPEYGVLASWGVGHFIEYVGRRPAVTDNFGNDIGEENFRLGLEFFRMEPGEAKETLDRLKVRYVLVGAPQGKKDDRPLIQRLYVEDAKGLSRFRLVFEGPKMERMPGRAPPMYKVFEYVKGARVEGRAPAGEKVAAKLPFITPYGRRGVYEESVVADEQGRYVLTLPYSTRGTPPSVQVNPAYVLSAAGRDARVAVEEVAVLDGRIIPGPNLGP
jgi:dolichyl-diphosphooligosaccharide--protein glycosyltransferase